ncbi:histidine phosphatase family protein [Nocardioides sp. AE5]|uniref:histidine phosphatase family protein n=1 Tax=Nocardioides sp. AE5 TaxID=2962573 RepID=UPI0028819BCE|nr:histidine phosphatase family protein [Nocardioides sp. AE5]MDT0201668.1 histidine phosphatase family protein [Nocardioides sp. AE5]
MELLVVRHAQPERARPENGPADPALTDLGSRQADALGQWLTRTPEARPDRIIASTMRRARQTAEAIAERTGLQVETDERIAEFDLGAREYIPIEQLGASVLEAATSALQTGVWGSHTFDPDAFRARVRAGFNDIVADANAERVVVVCHGGVLNSWLSGVIGRPHGIFFMPHYTSVSRVLVGPDRSLRLGSLNELPQGDALVQ